MDRVYSTIEHLRLDDVALLAKIIGKGSPGPGQFQIARRLLRQFESIGGVLRTNHEDLVRIRGVSARSADEIVFQRSLVSAVARSDINRKPVLDNFEAVLRYCRVALSGAGKEVFRVLFLDNAMHLIADKCLQTGTVDHVTVYPREVVAAAIRLSASALILVRNNPSGGHRPSTSDIDLTRRIETAARPFAIKITDHVIVERNRNLSFREYGLI